MDLNFKKIGKGPSIVVLHGLFGMSDNWISIAKKMSNDYCFYLVDLRNHGSSPHSDVFNYDVMTNDVRLFLEKQNLSDVTLLGHSMGGKIAMNFAAKYPQFLIKLIVVDIALRKYNAPHFINFINSMLSIDLLKEQSRKGIENILLSRLKVDPAIIHFLLKNLYKNDNNHFNWRINLQVIKENVDEILGSFEINKPVIIESLFMKGSVSDYIRPEDELVIKHKFSNSQIVEIENATHWVHSSSPLNFEKALRNFL